MSEPFPLLRMSYEQISLLTAQLLVYQQYLQRRVAPSAQRNRLLRIAIALIRRLSAMWEQTDAQKALLLSVDEVALIKEALTVIQRVLETKPPSLGRDQEIKRVAAMKMLIEQTFSTTQD